MAELSHHPDVVALAEYAEGLLDDAQRAAIEVHVRGCPDCARTLADLRELPATLAAAPLPSMPADVAERLDQAIAAESRARAAGRTAVTPEVTPLRLRSRRRRLAPLAAAAAVIGAIGIAVPVLTDGTGSTDTAGETAGETAGAESSEEGGAAPESDAAEQPNAYAPNSATVPALTGDSFESDVVDVFYPGSIQGSRKLESLSSDRPSGHYADVLASVDDPCQASSVPGGTIDAITYDGTAARLLRQKSGAAVDAIAFRCVDDEPVLLDATTLRP